MHRTTIDISDSLFHQARTKALREEMSVPEVVRDPLARWVAGEIDPATERRARQGLVHLAREAQGMWADRDAGAYLASSRSGLDERDKELRCVELYNKTACQIQLQAHEENHDRHRTSPAILPGRRRHPRF